MTAPSESKSSADAATRHGRSALRITPTRAVAAALLLIVASLVVWHRSRGPLVDTSPARRKSVADRIVATGKVLPAGRVHLGSVALGTVRRVDVAEGDHVKQGQVLIALDDTEAQAMVAQARASLQQAESRLGQVGGAAARVALEAVKQSAARVEQARAALERETALLSTGASTQQRLDDATKAYDIAVSEQAAALVQAASAGPGGADYRVAASQVAVARAALDAANARLAQTTILAPADGVVLSRDVEPGDVVQPGRVVMTISRDGPTRLSVQVDEKNLALLRVGQRAAASADAFPLERFDAKVTFIAPAVDASRGTIESQLEVDHPPSYLRPDMTVSVVIDAGTRDNVLLVRGGAVRDASTMSPFVLVVQGNRAVRRSVKLGSRTGESVEIVSGLQDGEVVVVGAPTIADGQRVRTRLLADQEADGAL
jgi:HlyD family secretion protein